MTPDRIEQATEEIEIAIYDYRPGVNHGTFVEKLRQILLALVMEVEQEKIALKKRIL